MGAAKIFNTVLLGCIVAVLMSEFANYADTIQLPTQTSVQPAAPTLVSGNAAPIVQHRRHHLEHSRV